MFFQWSFLQDSRRGLRMSRLPFLQLRNELHDMSYKSWPEDEKTLRVLTMTYRYPFLILRKYVMSGLWMYQRKWLDTKWRNLEKWQGSSRLFEYKKNGLYCIFFSFFTIFYNYYILFIIYRFLSICGMWVVITRRCFIRSTLIRRLQIQLLHPPLPNTLRKCITSAEKKYPFSLNNYVNLLNGFQRT